MVETTAIIFDARDTFSKDPSLPMLIFRGVHSLKLTASTLFSGALAISGRIYVLLIEGEIMYIFSLKC